MSLLDPKAKPANGGATMPQGLGMSIVMVEGKVMVNGPLDKKRECVKMLTEAIKIVVDFDPEKAKSQLTEHVDPLLVKKLKGN